MKDEEAPPFGGKPIPSKPTTKAKPHFIEGTLYVGEQVRASSLADAAAAFRLLHPGARIVAIDDKEVVGFCESCDRPFFDGDEYNHDDEGVMWCIGECAK